MLINICKGRGGKHFLWEILRQYILYLFFNLHLFELWHFLEWNVSNELCIEFWPWHPFKWLAEICNRRYLCKARVKMPVQTSWMQVSTVKVSTQGDRWSTQTYPPSPKWVHICVGIHFIINVALLSGKIWSIQCQGNCLVCQDFTEDLGCVFMWDQSMIFLLSVGNYMTGLSRLI